MPASCKNASELISAHTPCRAENPYLGARFRRVGCATLYGRPQSRAARRRGGHGRARAGAGRRRHRQDARADDADRPHNVHRPCLRLADSGRDLHQQGRARDEGAHRRAGGRRGGGHALARHLPRHGRQDPAPACRAGRTEIGLHDPRHRRPDPPHQAGHRERGPGQGPLAGPAVRRPARRLEEPRPHPRQGAARGGVRLCRRQGRASCMRPTRSA